MGKLGAALAASVVLTAVVGCSTQVVPTACPAIGYSTVVSVEVSGPRTDAVAAVQICSDDDGCSNGAPLQAPSDPLESPSLKPPSPLVTPETHQSEPVSLFSSFFTFRISEKSWEIGTGMVQPTVAIVQALDSSGEVLARTEAALEWTRIGGSEQCGGNTRSTTVRLDTE